MRTSQRFWRGLFFFVLIAALCGGLALPVTGNVPVPVHAAPPLSQMAGDVVISEFRVRGPSGGNDEFVELYNASTGNINISGWTLRNSANCGAADPAPANIFHTIGSVSLVPGEYYLAAGQSYSGTTDPDLRDATEWSIADGGGIAVWDGGGIVDQVGMCATTEYREGTALAPMTASAEQSYERKVGGYQGNCVDTNNNAADFTLNSGSSNPQNSSDAPVACLGVLNVDAPDGTYTAPATVDITVTFSGAVTVNGTPTLLLETGVTDRTATYVPGPSSNTVTFRYTVQAGDASAHLDYVAADSLALNGGTIRGPFGNALLTLPVPGAAGSLGANSNIVIKNSTAPSLLSFRRQSPSVNLTNNDTLTFRATFSEPLDPATIDTADFTATGTTGIPTAVTPAGSGIYDIVISGGDLPGLNGTVGLNLSTGENITDVDGLALPRVEPPPADDETYTEDNTAPTVTITTTSATANGLPVIFTVAFSEQIAAAEFTVSDVTQNGTAGSVRWNIRSTATPNTFELSAISFSSNGTLIPAIPAGAVHDAAGNGNPAVTGPTVNLNDTAGPDITIEQAAGQADPTASLPIRFTVHFSELFNTSSFEPADIWQAGTAAVNTWTITPSATDPQTYTIAATSITGIGTVIPVINAGQVLDLLNHPNAVSNATSPSSDNQVTFRSTNTQSVVISEFRTNGLRGPNDEFIELYNPTNNYVDISGWKVNASNDSGSTATRATIPASTILRSGQYYLIANNASNGYSGSVPPDLTYTNPITDGGGIALFKPGNSTPMDAVGLGTGSAYKEAPVLAPLTGNTDRSYERKLGGLSDSCQDTNNNANDFQVIPNSSPQNYSEPLRLCGNTGPSLITSTITIASDSPDPSLVYGYVKVAVRVRADSFQPSGALVNITATGLTTGCTIHLSTAGNGACTIRFTSVGAKTIRATFLGDNNHLSSKDTESHDVFVTTPTKYRTRTPTPAPPPPLVAINEFLPRPGHDWNHDGVVNTGDEYIELLNHGVVDVNLQGYKLDDEVNIGSNPFSLPSTILKPGERIVFYGSQTGLLLGDGGDAVRLLKPNGQLADAYNYSVVRFPDQSYCRLPDNGGLDDWNEFCFPTPGLPNSLSQNSVSSPTGDEESLCPIADTLPQAFAFAECSPFGKNIWNSDFWDRTGWFDEKNLPESPGKSPVFAD